MMTWPDKIKYETEEKKIQEEEEERERIKQQLIAQLRG